MTPFPAQNCKYIFCRETENYAWELFVVRTVGRIIGGIPAAVIRVLDPLRNNFGDRACRRFFINNAYLCADGAIVVNPFGIAEAKADAA